MPRGYQYPLAVEIVTVLNVVTRRLDGGAVELDVRTLRDGLVECILRQSRVGTCVGAGSVCTNDVSHLGIHLGVAAFGLCVHMERTLFTLERHLRIAKRVVVDQIVDLIEIERIAVATVQVLVHDFRHDYRAVDVIDPVEIDDRAAQAVSLEIEVDVDVNIDLGINSVLDLVLDLVVNIVVNAVVGLVVDLVVEIVVDLVVVAVAVLVIVLVVIAVLVVTLGIERLNSELGLALGLPLALKLPLTLKLSLQIGLLLILVLLLILRIVLWLWLVVAHDELLFVKEHRLASKIADLLRLRLPMRNDAVDVGFPTAIPSQLFARLRIVSVAYVKVGE